MLEYLHITKEDLKESYANLMVSHKELINNSWVTIKPLINYTNYNGV